MVPISQEVHNYDLLHYCTAPSIKYVMAQKTPRGSALSMIRSVTTVAMKNTDTR